MHSYLEGHPSLILAIKRLEQLNPDQFEVYFEHRNATQIQVKDQQLENLSRSEDVGIAIRLIKDQKLGFSYTTSLEEDAIQKAVESALAVAEIMPADENVGFYSFGNAAYPNVDNFDPRGLDDTPLQEKVAAARALERYCIESDRRITGVRTASLSEICLNTHLVDSNGEYLHHQSTGYLTHVTCKAEADGDRQIGSDSGFSNYFDNIKLESVARQSSQHAIENLGARTVSSMKCPVVLRNSVAASLIDFLAASFSAEQLAKGRSMLAGQQGECIVSDRITLINDALYSGGMGTSPFDGEGYPSRKTLLIDGGFLTGALYDTYYARKNETESTGSAVRGIKSPPTIGYSNLYLQAGKKSVESLYQPIQKGILITDLMGLHTANSVTGHFSLGASGILIENGELTTPVKGFAVAGNILELLRRVTNVGSDFRFFGRVGAPSISLSELSVSGT
jgi:PmbA protein